MSRKKRMRVELRYYEIPQNDNALVLSDAPWKRRYGYDVDYLHFHNLLEIGICHYGSGSMLLDDGTEFRYFDGSCTSIPHNLSHTTISDGINKNFWEYIFIDVEKFISETYSANPLLAHEIIENINGRAIFWDPPQNDGCTEIIMQLINEYNAQSQYREEIMNSLINRLLLEIARHNSQKQVNIQKSGNQHLNKIALALSFVNAHYADDIKISELARNCGLSETHFRRLFIDAVNMAPVEYINLVRIERACEQLCNNDCSMDEVALRVGFKSQATFNRNFRRMIGTSPYQWKRTSENAELRLANYNVSVHKGW